MYSGGDTCSRCRKTSLEQWWRLDSEVAVHKTTLARKPPRFRTISARESTDASSPGLRGLRGVVKALVTALCACGCHHFLSPTNQSLCWETKCFVLLLEILISWGRGNWQGGWLAGWPADVLPSGGSSRMRNAPMCFLGLTEGLGKGFWQGRFFGCFADFCCVRNA